MQRNVRSLAFGRYVPIGDIAAAAHSKRKRPATEATSFDAVRSDRLTQVGLEKELFLDLHNVPAYRLLRFVTLGCQVCPGLRLIKCNRIVHAVPLDDGHILGSCRSFYVLNPSVQGAQCVTVGLLDRLADGWEVAGLGCSIDHFDLADTVGFQLSLRVQPLYGRCTKCGSGNGGEHDLGLCIHERFPLCGLNQAVRPPRRSRHLIAASPLFRFASSWSCPLYAWGPRALSKSRDVGVPDIGEPEPIARPR